MLTLYRINRWSYQGGLISKVEVVRETAQFVVLAPDKRYTKPREIREAKSGNYFATFEDAKAELIKRREADVQRADDRRSEAIQALKQAREFKLVG